MTYDEWKVIAKQLLAAYPNSAAQAETVLVYGQMLEHLDADIVADAVRRHVERSRFFPAVAEILDIANPEQEVRDTYDALPDFTGSMALSQAEWEKRLEQGMAASRAVEAGVAAMKREPERRSALPEGGS